MPISPEERPPSKSASTTFSSGNTGKGGQFPSNSRSHTPTLSSTTQAHPGFRTQLSSSSLASVASASGVPVSSGTAGVQQQPGSSSSAPGNSARPPLAKNLSSLRVASTASLRSEHEKDKSDTASATGVSVVGVMASSRPTSKSRGGGSKARSKSPGSATIRERDRERDKDKDKDGAAHPLATSKSSRALVGQQNGPKYRSNPHLPTGNAEPVPATLMYWSKAPVYGLLPMHGLRAHSVTLVDGVAWIFGGCDEKGCWKDVLCFNTGERGSGQFTDMSSLRSSIMGQTQCNGRALQHSATSHRRAVHTLRRLLIDGLSCSVGARGRCTTTKCMCSTQSLGSGSIRSLTLSHPRPRDLHAQWSIHRRSHRPGEHTPRCSTAARYGCLAAGTGRRR
jgi:hypothetical protein